MTVKLTADMPWTEHEDSVLLDARAVNKPYEQIAELFAADPECASRSRRSLELRVFRLKRQTGPVRRRRGRPSKDEVFSAAFVAGSVPASPKGVDPLLKDPRAALERPVTLAEAEEATSEFVPSESSLSSMAQVVFQLVRKKGMREVAHLAEMLDTDEDEINAAAIELANSGLPIKVTSGVVIFCRDYRNAGMYLTNPYTEIPGGDENHIVIGLVSDTHFGSSACDQDALASFYIKAQNRGARVILHAGDLVDGFSMHPDQAFAQDQVGYDAQFRDAVQNYPSLSDMLTVFISGNHDYSYVKQNGVDIVRSVCAERNDMRYVGLWTGSIRYGGFRFKMSHPGTSCNPTGAAKKLHELIARDAAQDRADVYILGHYHQAQAVYDSKAFLGLMAGSFQHETSFTRRLNLEPVIGGWILEFERLRSGQIQSSLDFIKYPTRFLSV